MLGLLRSVHPGVDRHYVGLDRFEGRQPGDPPGVTLKEAHRGLHGQARVQLVPGNVDTALSRVCNHLAPFDLVLISADTDERQLDRCWFFIQRIVTGETAIFAESSVGGGGWTPVLKARVDEDEERRLSEERELARKKATFAQATNTLQTVLTQLQTGNTANVDAWLRTVEGQLTGNASRLVSLARQSLATQDLAATRTYLGLAMMEPPTP
jgi:hypothetical protein